jgi:hypothetical protein
LVAVTCKKIVNIYENKKLPPDNRGMSLDEEKDFCDGGCEVDSSYEWCGGLPGWGIALIVIECVLVVGAVVFVIVYFFVIKPKKIKAGS